MNIFRHLTLILILTFVAVSAWLLIGLARTPYFIEQEAGFGEIMPQTEESEYDSFSLSNWQRPEGPIRVGLQVGHWKNSEVPEELSGLKRSGGGAQGGGKEEWEVMLVIAELTAELIEERGIEVEILPAAISPSYYADAFIALHADGNSDSRVSGFKIASPRWDYSRKADELEDLLYEKYAEATGLKRDSGVTWRMRGYYAFNWRRYEHAIHPMTPAVILETGFLTSWNDQRILIHDPSLAARGIADAVFEFLELDV